MNMTMYELLNKEKNNTITNFFLLDGLENLDDTFLIVGAVNSLEHLTVFPPPYLPHHFIIILLPKSPQTITNSMKYNSIYNRQEII